MNVQIRMPTQANQTPAASVALVALFAGMRPADREKLAESAQANPQTFITGLETYLNIWAQNDWVDDYKVERTGRWVAKLCPPDMLPSIRKMIEGKAPANQTDAMSVPSQTYAAFLAGLTAP